MAQGLDELIDWLVAEVAFYGDGCPVSELFAALRRFQSHGDEYDAIEDPEEKLVALAALKGPLDETDMKIGRLAWKWMVETGDVSVGVDGEWNYLTFDEIMSVPEEHVEKGSDAPVKDSKGKQVVARPIPDGISKPTKLPKLRPRVYVEEEVVWKTLTGHGPDFRRVPNLEWKLLIVISATKEEGILQGDLVRATGQDKRSVPKRTDFLSLKGYIAKRTHMVRGTKTSKLWLTKFAPALPAPENPLGGLDMSAEALTKDMEPVPWKNQWVDNQGKNGKEEIAYMALGQTIMAIIKAWGTVRIRDLKRKLGILGRKWQMKVMSKFLRRFDVQGTISYVAATFVGDKFVFKDCVRFERDPTPADWSNLLATGKKHSQYSDLRDKMPTKKLPKKKARNKKGKGKGRPAALSKSKLPVLNEENRNTPNPLDTNWVQEKPLANTVIDFVLTGAEEGYTAPEISKATIGSAFRRQVFHHMNNTCAPDVQPPSLREYQTSSQLKIFGKTRARVFTASGDRKHSAIYKSQEEELVDPALRGTFLGTEDLANGSNPSQIQATSDNFGFGLVQPSAFLEDGTSDLTILGRMEPGKPVKTKRHHIRRAGIDADREECQTADVRTPGKAKVTIAEQLSVVAPEQTTRDNGETTRSELQDQRKVTGSSTDAASTRPTRKRKVSQRTSYLDSLDSVTEEQDANANADGTPARKRRAIMKPGYVELAEALEVSSDESDVEVDRSNPGVYCGIPGSLNPDPHRKGRPRKSIVLIFRSDKIKDPNYLPGWTAYPRPPTLPSVKFTSRPRKKPTQPLVIDPSPPSPAASYLQSEQPGLAETKEPQVVNGAPAPESAHMDKGTTAIQKAEAQDATEEARVQPSAIATTGAISEGEPSTTGTNMITTNQASKTFSRVPRAERKSKKTRADVKWVCDKCGGEWKNDIGLKYHLEKAKVPCNPYYAEHPELMVKAKPVRTSRAILASPEPEAARPGSSNSNSSGSSLQSIGTAPRLQTKKARAVTKRTSFTPKITDSTESIVPRPVLKQRSILKNRLGISGVISPRGVQVSEAAAKETAAARPMDDTANPTDIVVNVQSRGQDDRSEGEDVEEELPYLKQIRAEQARSSRRPPFEPIQTQHGGSEEMCSTTADSEPQSREADVVDADLSTAANQVSATFDPYPTDVLESAAPQSMVHWNAALTEKSSESLFDQSVVESYSAGTGQQTPQIACHAVNGVPPFKRPPGDHIVNFKDCLMTEESALRGMRVSAIIEYLVDVNGGVFQTERVLHWAILKVYTTEFPGWPTPSMPGCSRALGELINQGRLRRDTMAVKTSRLWRMVTIVMRPDMDMNTKPVEDLRLVLKNVLPDMYIPPPFAPTESEKILFRERERPVKPRGKGPGRRDHKLVEGIAQLTAPFYAEKGMAGIRPNYRASRAKVYSDDEDERSVKRRKSKNTDLVLENGVVEFYPKMRRKRRQTEQDGSLSKTRRGQTSVAKDDLVLEPHKLSIDGSHAANPGISSLPASFFSSTTVPNSGNYSAPTEIQFYAPNTHLEDDYIPTPEPEEECQIDPRLLAASAVEEPTQEDEEITPPSIGEASFTPINVINDVKGSKGTWPSVSPKWFEKNDASFTMKGWMPTQIELLIDNLPKNMEQMAHRITSHCKTEQWADPDYGNFCTSVDGCRAYELSEQGLRNLSCSIVPHYLFINCGAKPEVSNMAPCELQWDEENEWTLETIPYEMLEDDDRAAKPSIPEVIPIDPKDDSVRAAGRQSAASRSNLQETSKPPRKYIRKPEKDPKVRELKVQRELTPYPQEKSDYFRAKGDDSFGVDWKAEDTRIAAYVAVSTLMGGINKAMDWGLMMRIFPEAKLSNLRKFWAMIKKEREGFINSLTEKFQEEFLEAYQKGILKPVGFDDPIAYGEQWLELVKWTLALVVKESIELPPNREQFDAELELVPADKGDFDWRDMYHHWQRSVFNKLQDSTSEPASTKLEAKQKAVDNDIIVARSWIRALCCTEPKNYTPYEIRDKFLTLVRKGARTTKEVNELLESTVFDLEHRRVAIKQKAQALSTGRPYKLNEHFSRTLDRYSNEDKFTVAAEFKLKLDNAFRNGEMVEIPWRTEDGMVLAAFNLQAHGRVCLEPVQRLEIPFGFKPGFYESRKFPKSYYRFDIKVTPTPAYLYNEEIDVLQRATAEANVPGEAEDGKLPMWCDFFGKPHRGRWFKMLAGMLFVLATRGAMTDQYATQALKPCFEQFEVEMIRKWGLKEGLLREISVPGGAVSVTEWWWLVAGMPLLEMTGDTSQDATVSANATVEAGAVAGLGEGTTGGRRSKDQYAQTSGRSRRRGKHRMIF